MPPPYVTIIEAILICIESNSITGFQAADEKPLIGRLRVVRLVDSPKFAALSYVWGGYSSREDVLTIQLSDIEDPQAQLSITFSCQNALRLLRRKIGAITVWVDAICMDQQNEYEKNWQILLMGEIYA
ncbi:heterokaryon incompatibility protein-domain-containing protein [Xylariaceae sp. FL1651]|nr:heterokaryon incompatibility protein-domain-containing protein [Xylariaceae sp. FL1651]